MRSVGLYFSISAMDDSANLISIFNNQISSLWMVTSIDNYFYFTIFYRNITGI